MLSAAARASLLQPQLADEQQRLRAAVDQLAGWLESAGRGLGGLGANEGWMLVPAIYPQRRGVSRSDPDTSAFGDRLTIVSGTDPPAGARLGVSMPAPTAPLLVDPSSCGPGRIACGFAVGARVLVADARATGEWFTVTARNVASVDHAPAALNSSYSTSHEAVMAAVEVHSIVYDAVTKQIRLVSPGADLPFLDGVSEFTVRWFGDPRPPQGPLPPAGEANCVVDADGRPRLTPLSAMRQSWVELSMEGLSDGPWCGIPPWQFDADLFRARLLRVTLRLDRDVMPGPVATGTLAGTAVDIAPRNLMRLR
jgi:hypothetical protein